MTNNLEAKFKRLLKEARATSLTKKEKEGIKSNLIYFMKKSASTEKLTPQKALFQKINFINLYFSKVTKSLNQTPALRYASLALIIAILSISTVAFAARNSLPGENLYGVKTSLNEKIMALTLFSDQAKAEYDINLAQLRLQEAETIASQNKLNNQSTQEVRSLLINHLKDIEIRIKNIESKEDVRIASEINTKLQELLTAHSQIISKLTKLPDIKN